MGKNLDISKLEEKTYKNYKEICSVLGEEIKNGESKKSQIKNWKRYFEFDKNGHKFIVTRIKEVPDRIIKNTGMNGEYVEYIDDIIMLLLSKDNEKFKDITYSKLLEETGLVNHSFRICWSDMKATSLATSIEEPYINYFFNKEYSKIKDVVKNSLNRLRKQGYIDYSEDRVLVVPCKTEYVFDEDGNAEYDEYGLMKTKNVEGQIREATTEEWTRILELRTEVAEEFGCKNEQIIRLKGMYKEYYELLQECLIDELGISKYFRGLKIVKNRDKITKYVDEQPVMEELNELLLKNHKISFEKEFENAYKWNNDIRNNSCFLDTQLELLDGTVNIKTNQNLGHKVINIKKRIRRGENIKFKPKYNNDKKDCGMSDSELAEALGLA